MNDISMFQVYAEGKVFWLWC